MLRNYLPHFQIILLCRYSKAKIHMLTKKLADASDVRVNLETQVGDLKKGLKATQQENKQLLARIQSMEAEIRRGNYNKRAPEVNPNQALDHVMEERDTLKKDLETAERIAKQANVRHATLLFSFLH